MTAYDAQAWSAFALATAGASAVLTGLLFVAVSLNLERVLLFPRLPGRAALTLSVLTSVLLASLFVLVPDQSRVALGVELAVLGLGLGILDVIWVSSASSASSEGPGQPVLVPALVSLAPAVALVVGGLTIEAEAGGGLYWVFGACLLGIVGTLQSTWALLVESHG